MDKFEKPWHKSSYGNGTGGNCVEGAEGPVTGIRDTRNRHLGHLETSAPEWAAFAQAIHR